MIGFVAVGTMMLVPMGLASYLFVVRGLRHTHLEVADVNDVGGGRLEGETDYVSSITGTISRSTPARRRA